MSFEELGLSAELLQAILSQGYDTPTPIQKQAIPLILEGKDVMAAAQTGTGKTAGFTLPMLQRLSAGEKIKGRKPVRALVITPTRELAAQVAESIDNYGSKLPLKTAVVFGGVKINPQIDKLRAGVDILIATPGRLLDHASQNTVDLSQVEILVLDEADRMLDMGFINDIKKVLALLPENTHRQNLLFSATFSTEIKALAARLLNDPVLVEVAPQNATADRIEQRVLPVDKGRKRELLSQLIQKEDWQQILVFTRTKHGANRLAEQLGKDGISAAAIHGNKSQGARTRALAGFKAGEIRTLVATDIAARGLDIDQLPHVVNYELPNVPEDYVHRIGRTARAGRSGEAVSLVCVDELRLLRDIERLITRDLPREIIEGFDIDPSIKAEPIENGRGRSSGGGRDRNAGGGQRSAAGGNAGRTGQGRARNPRAKRDEESGGQPAAKAGARRGGRNANRNGSANGTASADGGATGTAPVAAARPKRKRRSGNAPQAVPAGNRANGNGNAVVNGNDENRGNRASDDDFSTQPREINNSNRPAALAYTADGQVINTGMPTQNRYGRGGGGNARFSGNGNGRGGRSSNRAGSGNNGGGRGGNSAGIERGNRARNAPRTDVDGNR